MARSPRDTTGNLWEFTPYFLEQRGPQNIPQRFLKNAKWEDDYKTHPGYFAGVGSLVVHVEFNFEYLCWTEARYQRTERRWHIHRIAESELGLDIHLDELTSDEILQVTRSDSSTPSTLTGQQIRERVEEHTMSQVTDSFEEAEERMSNEELEYSEEPASRFSDSGILADENGREEATDHFADPEEAQARATQTQTATTIRIQPSLWAEPSNIQRAAGENPPDGGGGGGNGGGSGGSGGGGGGGGGGGNPPAAGGPPPGNPGGGDH